MKTIVLLNPKGGSGKTTVATNLCGYLAAHGHKTALMDFDAQGSSTEWLKQREEEGLSPVQGINAAIRRQTVTRSWQLRTDRDIEYLVVDTPAAFDRYALQDYVARADALLVPVMPSLIDVRAAARFLEDLLQVAKIRRAGKPVGLIANRTRVRTPVLDSLERLLCGLDIPLVTRLCDSQRYIQAISTGRSLYELPGRQGKAERERWRTLVDWLAHSLYPDRQPPPRVDAKVPRVQPGTFWEGTGNPRTVVDASGRMSLEA